MTKKEAIKELKSIRINLITVETSEWMSEKEKHYVDACDMAIKALEQEPILDKIRAEIKKEYLAEGHLTDYWDGIDKCLQIIDKYRAESETAK